MDLQNYLRVIRKRWRVLVATVLLVLVAGVVLTALSPRQYQSTLQFFVSTSDNSTGSELAQGGAFTQQRVKSYTELITTPKVLGPVAKNAGVSGSGLADRITAEAPPDTVLIEATVTQDSPQQALRIARALSKQFPTTVDEIERVSAQRASPIKVTTVREPTLNATPVSPRPVRNGVVALALGLLLGLGLAIVRDRLDTRVRTKSDLAQVSPAPVLGVIPFDSEAPAQPLSLVTDGGSSRAEAFRSLRTNLQFVDAAGHPKILVLTSTLPGEGKSTTAANLALALADSDASVCLIEGDLRRPRLLSYLGLEGAVGITDVLIGSVDVSEVMQQFGRRELWVLGAGTLPPNPSELLGSPGMHTLVGRLAARFDHVIIDAPPLLPVTDAAVLGALSDGVILVTGSGLVHREQVATAIDSLERVNANLLGIVLNRAPRSTRGAYDSRYYDYRSATDQSRHAVTAERADADAVGEGRRERRARQSTEQERAS